MAQADGSLTQIDDIHSVHNYLAQAGLRFQKAS